MKIESELRKLVYEECLKALAEHDKKIQHEHLQARDRKHLTASEVMEEYGISDRTLINWQHRGLKCQKVGRKKYYLIKDIEHYISFSSRL